MPDDTKLIGIAKRVAEYTRSPEYQAARAAELKEWRDRVTERSYDDLEFELKGFAARIEQPPVCDKCDVLSYRDACNQIADELGPEVLHEMDGWAIARGYSDLNHSAGYYRYCDACRRKPLVRPFAWAAYIPIPVYRAWLFEHPEAFPIAELAPLAGVHGAKPIASVPGWSFQIAPERPMATMTGVADEKPEDKGGLKFF